MDKLGYKKLRHEQEKVLRAFVGGRDVFAALPTGNFLCFALLPHACSCVRLSEGKARVYGYVCFSIDITDDGPI